MKIIEKGFNINYEVIKIGLIKPTKEFKADNGNVYPPSVKFKASNSLEVLDDSMGVVDKEETLEFKVICKDEHEMKEFNTYLRKIKQSGSIINIVGTLPVKYDKNDPHAVTVYNTPKELMETYKVK